MVSAVNPIGYSSYVSAVTANGINSPSAFDAYEELVALQNANDLLEIGTSSSNGSSTNNTVDSSLLTADLLDLSPAALNVLNGIEDANALANTTGVTDTTTITGTTGAIPLTTQLTPAQQQEAAAVIAQYAGSPLTQTTFNQIQGALTAEGINPQEVSIQQLLDAYAYAYLPAFSYDDTVANEVLASDLTDA